MDVLYVAKKYDVPGLVTKCCKYVTECLNADNICSLLNQAKLLQADELVDKCVDLFSKRTSVVLNSEAFLLLSEEALKALLESKVMNAKEEDLYVACKRWAVNTCERNGKDTADPKNIRETLGDCLKCIRFLLIPIKTFVETVVKDNILTEAEKIYAMQDIILGESTSQFSRENRKEPSCKNIEVCTASTAKRQATYSYTSNSYQTQNLQTEPPNINGISFTVSTSLVLTKLSLYTPATGTVTGVLGIFEDEKNIFSQDITLNCTGNLTCDVPLEHEVWLNDHKTYSLRTVIKGDNVFYGRVSVNTYTKEDISFDIKCIQDSLAVTPDNYTRFNSNVHTIYFKKYS